MLTAARRRADFPSLTDRVYLNTAAEGIPPVPVLEALGRYAREKTLGMDGRRLHESEWDGAKSEAARALGLTPNEIGFTANSSEAFNLAALALRLGEGDEVVINDLDFPSGATPWLQPTCPATAKVWRHRDGALRAEDLVPLLGPRTRGVTVSLVSFYNGFRLRLGEVAELVRQHSDALLIVDVTQALGRVPLDLTPADLVISSTHKWILASHGGGIVGVPARRAATWTVPAGGWFNLEDAFGADRFEQATSKPGAASFTLGMPNYAAIYAIRAGLGYLHDIGIERIAAAADPLLRHALDEVARLPVQLLTPREPEHLAGIFAFRHPDAERIHAALHRDNIHLMHHAGRLRVSIHGYNTAADVDRFLSALKGALDA